MHTQGTSHWAVTRDGRRLHLMALLGPDPDAPTVVFEAGAGGTRSAWALVQPGVSAFARAVVYNRAGMGRSDADPVGRTLDRMADDLGQLLDHLGPGPFLLVGHSAGGPIVRLTASRRPDRVAGLVLVDPTDEAADVLFSRRFRAAERVVLRTNLLLARTGLLKRLYRSLLDTAPARDVREDLEREGFSPDLVRTQSRQSRTFLAELAAWRTEPPPLPGIPITVISGALARDGMSPGIRAQVNGSHAYRAAQTEVGRHVIAANSGHQVPVTEPAVVVEEIHRLLAGLPH